jgi:UMF1 family MFS transporter
MKRLFLYKRFDKQVLAWAIYDWANSAFATTVLAGFFPLFFKQYWSTGLDSAESTFHLGAGNAVASLLIVLTAPLLGAIADRGSLRKRFLFFFALTGIIATAALSGVGQGEWLTAMMFFVVATIGFMGANVFYDALIVTVAKEEDLDIVSAFGFALGYLGGGLLFAVNVAMTLSPESFGLQDSAEAVQLSFITVAVWWLLFSLPIMLLVKEPKSPTTVSGFAVARAGYAQLIETFKHLRQLRVVFLFLLAYWLYIDGVDTIVRMAVDYGLSIGLEQHHLIIALLITQFVGFPAALGFGLLAKKLGPNGEGAKRGILLAIGIYIVATIGAFFMDTAQEFYALAITIGLVQGGVQALSRSLYARLIPSEKSAEFFGFYNMLGKFAAVIGPLMVGVVSLSTGDHRLGILSIIVLFIAGGWLLIKVDVVAGETSSKEIG